MTTIKEVAKLAGVSTATVSHVINSKRNVSPELAEKVNKAIADLDYRPSAIAKSLKLRKTFSLGVIVSDIQDSFFAAVVKGIRDYCYKYRRDYGILLGDSYENPKRALRNIKLFLDKGIDGLIVAPIGVDSKELDFLRRTQVPFVLINREFTETGDFSVMVNNHDGSYELTKYLLEMGHRNIGAIFGPQNYSTTRERYVGFKNAFLDRDLLFDDSTCLYSSLDWKIASKKTHELLSGDKKPTAIYATTHVILAGVLLAIRKMNLKIPNDLSVAAFSYHDAPWPWIIDPPLTMMNQPTYEIGWEAAKMVFAIMKGQIYKKRIVLDPEFIIRDSVVSLKGEG